MMAVQLIEVLWTKASPKEPRALNTVDGACGS